MKTDGSLYMLIPHIIKQGWKTPHHYFYAKGKVEYNITLTNSGKDYTLSVEIPSLTCDDCENMPYNVSYFSYTIYISDSADLIDYFSKCNLRRNYIFEKSTFKYFKEEVQY